VMVRKSPPSLLIQAVPRGAERFRYRSVSRTSADRENSSTEQADRLWPDTVSPDRTNIDNQSTTIIIQGRTLLSGLSHRIGLRILQRSITFPAERPNQPCPASEVATY